eukprot:EG_transcript_23780
MAAVDVMARPAGMAPLSLRQRADGRLSALRATLQRHSARAAELTQRVEEARAAMIALCLSGPRPPAAADPAAVEVEARLQEWQWQLCKEQVAVEQTARCIALLERQSAGEAVPLTSRLAKLP